VPVHPRVLVLWTGADVVQVVLAGWVCPELVEALERAVDDLFRGGGRHLTIDLTRLQGSDVPVLELLAALSHRLRRADGCLHTEGLDRRLVSRPEVSAFPELFGDVGHPDPVPVGAGGRPVGCSAGVP
jgi:anti-anti-sigma regulatory factor